MSNLLKSIKHINGVKKRLRILSEKIQKIALFHDQSWLKPPEVGLSEDDQQWKDAHYKTNTHHPEHFNNDVSKMTLVDIIEMFCDWVTENEDDGADDLDTMGRKYKVDPQLVSIFKNTLNILK
jgi:hypothetical protein